MSVVNLLIIICGVVAVAIAFVRKKFSFWSDRGVVHVPPSFPFGNLAGLGRTHALHDIMHEIYKKTKHTGAKFAGIYFFIKPAVLVLDLEFAKTVLIKDFQYFHDRNLYNNVKDDPLTGHLFFLEGEKWKHMRNKMTPAFTSGKMKFMFPTIVAVSEEFRETMEKTMAVDSNVNVKDLMARFTTDVIGTCAFGLECNSLKNPDAEFRRFGKKIFTESAKFFKVLLASQFKTLSRQLGVKILKDDITKFFMGAVRSTIEAREQNDIRRNDFMNMLIEMKNSADPENQLTLEEVAAQAFVFFVAGFETSSTTLTFSLYELARNQDVQNKARDCVQNVLQKHDNQMTYEAIMEMTYITQCINESLRKYPPGTNSLRSVTEDYPVPGTDIVFPKGINIIVPIHAIHHDPEYYPNPEIYDPDRFTPENEATRPSLAFIPFGEGPRKCIGMRFGLLQAHVGLAQMLNNFKFEVSDVDEPLVFNKAGPIMQPLSNIYLKVEKC